MGVENPGYLWAAAAAVIPLILHLIARRRARVVDFAAVEFILRSNRRIARRLKLKQWLLLFFRMLLIAAVPIAFSKPYVLEETEVLPATGGAMPVSVVLVVDASMSMGYERDGEVLLETALSKAKAILDDLRHDSDAAVVVATSPARALNHRLTFDRNDLHSALKQIALTDDTADMQGALRLAEQILVASSQSRREIVLLTDLQATEWTDIRRPWALDRAPRVTLVDLRDGMEPGNGAITRVVAEPESGGLARDVRIQVEILNDRPQTYQEQVTVRVGGRTAVGIIHVPSHQTGTKEFSIRLDDMGAVSGSVEIPPDGLIRDNQSHFVVDFLRRVHVLVVNGSSRTVPHRDETFFLRAALRPADGATARVNATYVKPDELTPAQLAYVDVVILANVVTLDPQQVSALEAWVQRGGGLFVTGGENVSEAVYNGALRPLIPLPVREIREAGDQPLFLTGIADGHPLLNVFGHLPDASLYSAPTERYVLLDTAAQSDVRVLATFTDGAPALVEGAVGKGRLMMLTTTLDRDWSSLAFTTSYLPLMQQIILYLSGRLQQPEQSNVIVGLSRTIQVGRDVERIMVVRPDGQEFSFDGADLATGEVRFRPTTVAGIYRVLQHRLHGVEESFFSVGIDPVESVLRGTDHDEVESLLESGQRNSDRDSVHPVGPAEPVPGRRENLWPLLLIALFVLLVMETWLAYQAS